PSSDVRITRFFRDTITMMDCDSVKLKLQVFFSGCDFMRFHDVKIDYLLPSNYLVNFKKDNPIRSGHPDTATITIFPNFPGTYHLLVHVNLASSDWTGYDTLFPLTLIVRSFPPNLIITGGDSLKLGLKPICLSAGKDTIVLSNPSCEIIHISDIHFEPDSVSKN